MTTTERATKGPTGRGSLTRDVIVEAAIEVIDTAGLAGLTMRRLGATLDADAMAVYGYFENKAALLDAVVEHEAARLGELPDEFPEEPIEAILHIARYLRTVLLEHPNLAPIVASRPLPQPRAPALVQLAVHMFQQAGFADDDIPLATDALATFVLGFILQESGRSQWRAELGDEFNQQQLEIRDRLAAMPTDTAIAQAIISRRLDDNATTVEFETGIRAMLHGLRLGLGRAPGEES
jgi:TetR/AcrR family transcriptional regulator, tetracycline repressor protein